MSHLRAKCPDCHTLTAVALGGEYECHSCGSEYRAGLVRVPRAWGKGGEEMVAAASLPLPYPEALVVEEDTLGAQTLAIACDLPETPLVLGGCCCSHVGAIEGLSTRFDRLAVVWFDAHGDLNTPASSPSGNEWGMPLRMAIASGAVAPEDVALVGARALDPPEEEFIAQAGVHRDDAEAALDGADAVYVALDVDVLVPEGDVRMFMPEPGGPTSDEVAATLERIVAAKPLAGAGFTGVAGDESNVAPLTRFARALGL